MKRFFFALLAAAVVGFASPAFADAPRVVVVEVSAERVDADRIRRAIAADLGVTTIAPDDARAASANERIVVSSNASTKKLTVTYTKAAAPVTRTVELPDDRKSAEDRAVLLAGNVARDEASELLPAKPAPPPPPPPAATTATTDDEGLRVRRIRVVFADAASESRTHRYVVAGSLAGLGAVTITTGILNLERNGPRPSNEFSSWLIGLGAAEVLGAGLSLAFPAQSEHESFDAWLASNATAGLEDVEREWRRRAEKARAARKVLGYVLVGLGAVTTGYGVASTLITTRRDAAMDTNLGLLYGGGAFEILLGLHAAFVREPIESSLAAYEAAKSPGAAAKPRVVFGGAPIPGGGVGTFGLVF